jgi:hypothetical protein
MQLSPHLKQIVFFIFFQNVLWRSKIKKSCNFISTFKVLVKNKINYWFIPLLILKQYKFQGIGLFLYLRREIDIESLKCNIKQEFLF